MWYTVFSITFIIYCPAVPEKSEATPAIAGIAERI